MSLVARMKEQFKGQGGVTPEAHKILLKTQREKEEQAVLIAKARAARYNLTLRTVELQAQTTSASTTSSSTASSAPRPDPSKIVKGTTADDYKKSKGAVEVSDKPNPFKVQLRKVGAPPSNVAEALHHNRSPSIAKAVVETAAAAAPVAPAVEAALEEASKPKAKTEEQVTILEAKDETTKEVVVVEVSEKVADILEEAKVEVTADVVETIRTEAAPSVVGQEFEMTDLKKALEEGNQEKINEAVVTEFLETHAPEMVSEVPALMEEFKGNEAELMEKLAEDHPDPAEKIEADAVALITGATIADAEEKKEIEEAHQEEVAKVAEMTEEDRKEYEATNLAVQEVAIEKDNALKEELQIMQEAVANAGEEVVKEATADEAVTLGGFIISAVNTDGEWQVNPEEGAAASE